MHSLNYRWEFNKFWLGCAGVLLASGNWKHGAGAGVGGRAANNGPAAVNADRGGRLEAIL